MAKRAGATELIQDVMDACFDWGEVDPRFCDASSDHVKLVRKAFRSLLKDSQVATDMSQIPGSPVLQAVEGDPFFVSSQDIYSEEENDDGSTLDDVSVAVKVEEKVPDCLVTMLDTTLQLTSNLFYGSKSGGIPPQTARLVNNLMRFGINQTQISEILPVLQENLFPRFLELLKQNQEVSTRIIVPKSVYHPFFNRTTLEEPNLAKVFEKLESVFVSDPVCIRSAPSAASASNISLSSYHYEFLLPILLVLLSQKFFYHGDGVAKKNRRFFGSGVSFTTEMANDTRVLFSLLLPLSEIASETNQTVCDNFPDLIKFVFRVPLTSKQIIVLKTFMTPTCDVQTELTQNNKSRLTDGTINVIQEKIMNNLMVAVSDDAANENSNTERIRDLEHVFDTCFKKAYANRSPLMWHDEDHDWIFSSLDIDMNGVDGNQRETLPMHALCKFFDVDIDSNTVVLLTKMMLCLGGKEQDSCESDEDDDEHIYQAKETLPSKFLIPWEGGSVNGNRVKSFAASIASACSFVISHKLFRRLFPTISKMMGRYFEGDYFSTARLLSLIAPHFDVILDICRLLVYHHNNLKLGFRINKLRDFILISSSPCVRAEIAVHHILFSTFTESVNFRDPTIPSFLKNYLIVYKQLFGPRLDISQLNELRIKEV